VSAEGRLAAAGIQLPATAAAAGLYAPCVRTGSLLFVSGQLPVAEGKLLRTGKCGAEVTVDEANACARQCALNALAVVRGELRSLDRIIRVVRVAAYVASAPGFTAHPQVANGASQLLLDVFGEAGRHARVAVGMAELPFGAPVEVEFLFEVRDTQL
jgi:enamine deaminase RidA (YjgF/YER057c/UK114 family)